MKEIQFGVDIPKANLIKDYGELYYDEEQNFKQRESNKFVLHMLSASRWRFSTKLELLDWGRDERTRRIQSLIRLSSVQDINRESKYYNNQSLVPVE